MEWAKINKIEIIIMKSRYDDIFNFFFIVIQFFAKSLLVKKYHKDGAKISKTEEKLILSKCVMFDPRKFIILCIWSQFFSKLARYRNLNWNIMKSSLGSRIIQFKKIFYHPSIHLQVIKTSSRHFLHCVSFPGTWPFFYFIILQQHKNSKKSWKI